MTQHGSWTRGDPPFGFENASFLFSHTSGDYLEGSVWLAAGTYTLILDATQAGDRGIADVLIDGAAVGTFDLYASGSTIAMMTLPGVVVTTTGPHTVRWLNTGTHNPSSSDFYTPFNFLAFSRTDSGGDPDVHAGWPVNQLIIGHQTPKAQSNFDNVNPAQPGEPAGSTPFGSRYSDDADGAWIEWDVALAAGTYTLEFHGWQFGGTGILRFALNDGDGLVNIDAAPYNASGSTVDQYTGGAGNSFFLATIADDLVIPADGVYTLRATVTGKNASSSGFVTNILNIQLQRIVGAIGVTPTPPIAAGGGYLYLPCTMPNSQHGFDNALLPLDLHRRQRPGRGDRLPRVARLARPRDLGDRRAHSAGERRRHLHHLARRRGRVLAGLLRAVDRLRPVLL
jgi:hypothetical protein